MEYKKLFILVNMYLFLGGFMVKTRAGKGKTVRINLTIPRALQKRILKFRKENKNSLNLSWIATRAIQGYLDEKDGGYQ